MPITNDDGEIIEYKIYQAVLIVRYSADGKLYLYDIQNIKKETRYPSWTNTSDGQKPASSEDDCIINRMVERLYELEHKKDTAKKKVATEIDISSSRLAIIPKGETKEVLAYEFQGEKEGETYYIYVDAISGKEVEIFKVIDTTEGLLLM